VLLKNEVDNLAVRLRSLTVDKTHVHIFDYLRRSRLNHLVNRLGIRVDLRAARRGMDAFDLKVFEAILRRILKSKIRNHDVAESVLVPPEIKFDLIEQYFLGVGGLGTENYLQTYR